MLSWRSPVVVVLTASSMTSLSDMHEQYPTSADLLDIKLSPHDVRRYCGVKNPDRRHDDADSPPSRRKDQAGRRKRLAERDVGVCLPRAVGVGVACFEFVPFLFPKSNLKLGGSRCWPSAFFAFNRTRSLRNRAVLLLEYLVRVQASSHTYIQTMTLSRETPLQS